MLVSYFYHYLNMKTTLIFTLAIVTLVNSGIRPNLLSFIICLKITNLFLECPFSSDVKDTKGWRLTGLQLLSLFCTSLLNRIFVHLLYFFYLWLVTFLSFHLSSMSSMQKIRHLFKWYKMSSDFLRSIVCFWFKMG